MKAKWLSPLCAMILFDLGVVRADYAWVVSGTLHANSESGIKGVEFTPNVDLIVSKIGWYDDTFASGPGLAVAHAVGIFDAANQQLLTSGTVPAGTAGPLFNLFRFVDVTPVTLSAGHPYVVAGVAAGDAGLNVTPGQSMTVSPFITLGPWRLGGSSTLSFPSTVLDAPTRRMGPTFYFEIIDTDDDGVPDSLDECPDTVPGADVNGEGCPPTIPGDLDRDGDVDLADLAGVLSCFSGAGYPADPLCAPSPR